MACFRYVITVHVCLHMCILFVNGCICMHISVEPMSFLRLHL